jgi:hypothetical protein
MRQGWTFLDDGSSLVPRGVLDLRKHLQPARFSTFNAEGAGLLSELFGLAPNERPPVSGEKAKEMPIAKNRTTKGATKPSPKKRVADTDQGTAKKPTRKATKSHEQD